MESSEQPRRARGVLFVIGLAVALAAVWAAVALASGSGSGSGSVSTSNTPAPVASYYGGADVAAVQSGPRGGPDGDCPDHDGGSTTPSTPSAPATPSTQSTVDGSTNPSL